MADGSPIPDPLPAGKKLDCFQRILVDSSAPPPTCSFNTTDGGDYDITRPESGAACSYGSDGATGSITYTYKTLKAGKDGTCTKLSPDPTKTDNCCRGTPYSCMFAACGSSSGTQQATCTRSSSYLGGANCPTSSDKYVNGSKYTGSAWPQERACDNCEENQYSNCTRHHCSVNDATGKYVNRCTTKADTCAGTVPKMITTNLDCRECLLPNSSGVDGDYTCSPWGSTATSRLCQKNSVCYGPDTYTQTRTCGKSYLDCSWDTSLCANTTDPNKGKKHRVCNQQITNCSITTDSYPSGYANEWENCSVCAAPTPNSSSHNDYDCTYTANCPSDSTQTNPSDITAAMKTSSACTPKSYCKPADATPVYATRTCATCSATGGDKWEVLISWGECGEDGTKTQNVKRTFNCTVDTAYEQATGAVDEGDGITSSMALEIDDPADTATPKRKIWVRTQTQLCQAPAQGNLPAGTVGQTLYYQSPTAKWKPSSYLFNKGPRIGIGTGYSLTATPTEVLQVSANANKDLTSRLLVVDNDPFQAAGDTSNNPEIQLQYATTTVSGAEKNWHWSLFVDKTAGSSQNSFNIWGAGYDGATGSNRLTILPNGNVGIGVSDPGLPLQIDHATAPFLGFRTIGDAANSVRFSVGARDGGANARRAEIEVQSKHDLAFLTDAKTRAFISSDGSTFTIGTSTQFADSAQLLVHKAAIPGAGVILGESAGAPAAGSGSAVQPTSIDRTITGASVTAPATDEPVPQSVPAGAGGVTNVNTLVTPKTGNLTPTESGPETPATQPAPQQGTEGQVQPKQGPGARGPEKTLLSSLSGFFSNLWRAIAGNPIQSSYAVNMPRLSTGAASPAVGAQTVVRKKLKGQSTLFQTGLAPGDYIYIPAKNALFMLESATSETEGTFIQIAGELIAGTATFASIGSAEEAPANLSYSILKKGNVFRVERDMKDANGNPSIAADLIVDNRGIVNIGGEIAPPEKSDLSLYVKGKVGAKEFCILGNPNDCATSWKLMNPWVIKGDNVYRSKGKVGIGTADPVSQLDVLVNIAELGAPPYTYTEAGALPEDGRLTPQCTCDSADGVTDCPTNRWEGASKEFYDANERCYDWRGAAVAQKSKLYLRENRPQGGGAMGNNRVFATPYNPNGLLINYARFGYHRDLDTPGIIFQQYGKMAMNVTQYIMGRGYMKGESTIVNASDGRAFGLQFNPTDLSVISNSKGDYSQEGAVQKLFSVTPNGFIPPRVETPAIFPSWAPGEDGLTVWDSTEKKYKVYTNGVGWRPLGGNDIPFTLEQGTNFTERPVEFQITRALSSGQNYSSGPYRYIYRVVAELSNGAKLSSPPSDPIYLREAFSYTNYVSVRWPALTDVKKYSLYRLVDRDNDLCRLAFNATSCQGITPIAIFDSNNSYGTTYEDRGEYQSGYSLGSERVLPQSSNEYKAIFDAVESNQWMKFAVGTEQNTIDVQQRAPVYRFIEDISSGSNKYPNGTTNQEPCSFANAVSSRELDTPPAVATEPVGTYCYDPYIDPPGSASAPEKWRTYRVVSRNSGLILAKDGNASLGGSLAIGYTQPSNEYALAVNGGVLIDGPIAWADGRPFYNGATLNLLGGMNTKLGDDTSMQWDYEKYRRTFGLDDDRNMAIQIGALDELPGNRPAGYAGAENKIASHSIGVTVYNGDYKSPTDIGWNRYFYVAGRDTGSGCAIEGTCKEDVSFFTRPSDGKAYFKGAVAIGGGLREVTGSDLMLDVQGGDINVALGTDTLALNKKDKLALAQGKVGYDVAELFDAEEEVEAGDVLVVTARGTRLKKSTKPYEEGVIGIVSASPALVFEGSELKIGPKPNRFTKGMKPPIALSGRVSAKVSLENGPIKAGDTLTSSSKPGVAMRATKPGPTLGIALEAYDGKKDNSITVFVSLGEKNVKYLIDEVKDLRTRLEKLEKKK